MTIRDNRLRIAFWLMLLMLCTGGVCRADSLPPPRAVTLPSAAPSGFPTVDLITLLYYPAASASLPTPAVVVLPPSGGSARDPILRRLAQHLAARGIACAVMDLPLPRLPEAARRRPRRALFGGQRRVIGAGIRASCV